MSWSISLIGTPEKVKEALNKQSENLTGQSKVEYDSVLPALLIFADQNFNAGNEVVIKLTANGHGTASGDRQLERYCSLSLERVYALLV